MYFIFNFSWTALLTEPLMSRDTLVPAQLYLQMMRGNSKFTYTPPELKVPHQFKICFTRQVGRGSIYHGLRGVKQNIIGRWLDISLVGGSFFFQFWRDLFLWIDCYLYIIIISSKTTYSHYDISEKLLTNLFVTGQINWNLIGSNYGRCCIKVQSKQIGMGVTQTQPTEPLIYKLYCWKIMVRFFLSGNKTVI